MTTDGWYPDTTVPEGVTINDALTGMVQHSIDNPTHGSGCACKDRFVWAARRRLNDAQREELRYLARLLQN